MGVPSNQGTCRSLFVAFTRSERARTCLQLRTGVRARGPVARTPPGFVQDRSVARERRTWADRRLVLAWPAPRESTPVVHRSLHGVAQETYRATRRSLRGLSSRANTGVFPLPCGLGDEPKPGENLARIVPALIGLDQRQSFELSPIATVPSPTNHQSPLLEIPDPLSPQPLHPPPCSFPWSGVTNGPCLPGQGSARKPGDLCDARKPRPTTVKDGSDDCCCSQLVTVAQADRRLWREDGGRISRSGGRGGTTERRRIRCPGCHEAREAGCGARRGRPSRTRPGQRRRTRASGPRAGWFRREQPA